MLVAGEPGIGKTRLATEAAHAAHADGGTVLFGACDEDVGLPYRPFVEATRSVKRIVAVPVVPSAGCAGIAWLSTAWAA